ncbi:hypothetical protein RJ53_08705 [Methanocalculus chunghsingensis]|uniref:CHASE domain-containing protein n=1 Tax=Methanocalculus chunghsingensis TaxID=156457 RepID=A0A8J7WBB7_9EURY|nr:cache domain-containing protein [Methanocalculus chunghsingensis]MBR1369562.1 hypothetical protein [Methanocalculus chunghsingensis]
MNSPVQTIAIAITCLFIGVVIGSLVTPIYERDDASTSLIHLQSDITEALEALDHDLAVAAYALGETGIEGDDAREILLSLSKRHPAIIDCTTVDPDGIIIAAEPPAYHTVEGVDVSHQQATRHILMTKRPIMSGIIPVVEGMEATFIGSPIFSHGEGAATEGQFIGFTSIVFHPDVFLDEIVSPVMAGTPYTVTIVDTEGRVLYDTDPDQIGLPLDDPAYSPFPELIALVTRVTEERQGKGTYIFRGETKEAIWTTVSLHGEEWRVSVVRVVG